MKANLTAEQESRHDQQVRKAATAVHDLFAYVNGIGDVDALADAIASEHPTLIGQLAKAVGIGVMRRTLRDSTWQPYDRTTGEPDCREGYQAGKPLHPSHDGRLDCDTIVGATYIARQSFI